MTPRRVRAVSGHERFALTAWRVRSAPAGAIAAPEDLPDGGWTPAAGPATAAATLRAQGAWSLDDPPRRFDAEDWWWRARADVPRAASGEAFVLVLGGLATIADVWWNGVQLLHSDDMFLGHELPLGDGTGELVICCRALDAELARKRPRPRWRAPMIEHQQLRWSRTTLLGRTPGWSPPAAPVGPWREVVIERRRGVVVEDMSLRANVEGGSGVLDVTCRCPGAGTVPMVLVVVRGGRDHRAVLEATGGGAHAGRLVISGVELWWPHTHGEPACYQARLELGDVRVDLGPVGFRTIAVTTANGDFALSVNGVSVFCRGACWTPLDPVSLAATPEAYDAAVAQVAAAGMNMLRVGGTMVYEADAFHDACDARGVLVWQDLMFANMDYPEDDAAFVATALREVRQELSRLCARPSLAIVCGGSEVEQQAAMWGAGSERWSPRLSHEIFPPVVAEVVPDVAYWPSSAHGGAFPHAADQGTTSYYGVGAYLRPLDDARRAEVRFASECLAFANLPASLAPGWRARTPRDLGASWDFDDVRDHYVATLYDVDAGALRRTDVERYQALGRVATGEVMAAVFGEWRRARSTCRGGLIWFLRDLWPGAGWGVIDANGAPKAAYHILRRALLPVALAISDEGGNGLALHIVNDGTAALAGEVALTLWRAGEIAVGGGRRAVAIPAHGALELAAAALLDHFVDLSYAYRFGPPPCDLVVATLRGSDGEVLAETFHFPAGRPATRELDVGLVATAEADRLTVATRRFAQSVSIAVDGHRPDDDFFHLAPGSSRTVRVRPVDARGGTIRGTVTALNAEVAAKIGGSA